MSQPFTFLWWQQLDDGFRWNQNDPKREGAKGKQAGEERDDDGGEHEDDLLAVFYEVAAIALRGYQAGVDHQVLRDDGVERD